MENNKTLLSLLSAMPDAVLVYDQGKVSFCSDKAVEYFGAKSPGDLLGLHVTDLVHPSEIEKLDKRREVLLSSTDGTVPTERVHLKRLDGTFFYADSSAKLVQAENGPLLLAVIHDVTEQIEVEKKLAESEQNYRLIFEESQDATYLFDPETNCLIDVNHVGASMLGYTRENMIGRDLDEISPPEGGEEERKKRIRKLLGGEVLPLRETFHIAKDGSAIPVEIRNSVVQQAGRKLIHFTARDISDRFEIEKALRVSENRFRDFAISGADRFWETDADHKYTFISPPAGYMKRPTELLMGEYPWGVTVGKHSMEHNAAIRAAFESKQAFRNIRHIGITPDGVQRHLALSGIPFFTDNNDFAGFRGSTTDETKEVEARAKANLTQTQYFDAIEHLSDAVSIYDSDMKLVACNSQAKADYEKIAHLMKIGTPLEEILVGYRDHIIMPDTEFDSKISIEKVKAANDEGFASNIVQYRDGRWKLVNRYRTVDGGMCPSSEFLAQSLI